MKHISILKEGPYIDGENMKHGANRTPHCTLFKDRSTLSQAEQLSFNGITLERDLQHWEEKIGHLHEKMPLEHTEACCEVWDILFMESLLSIGI